MDGFLTSLDLSGRALAGVSRHATQLLASRNSTRTRTLRLIMALAVLVALALTRGALADRATCAACAQAVTAIIKIVHVHIMARRTSIKYRPGPY